MASQALGEAVERLRRFPLPPGALEGAVGGAALVVTGTGFWGADRAAVRELCALAGGVIYSGDLVRGRTTLLLLRWAGGGGVPPEAAAAAAGGHKLAKALEWGVPAVRLAWLLDSAAAGRALPLRPYLVPAAERQGAAAPPAAEAAPGCQQLPLRHRPSSVASSQPGTAAAQQQQQRQQQGVAAQPQRRPMAPVANLLADQLRRMSISPEPPPLLAACPPPPQPQPQPQRRSPPLPGSPQRSLSLRGLADMDREGGTPGAPAGGDAAAAHDAQRQQQQQAEQQPAAPPPGAFAPMQDSPADAQPLPPSQLGLRHDGCGSPGDDVPQPLARAFGRSVSEDLPAGSPMTESPAGAVATARAASPAATYTAGGSRGTSVPRPRSRLAGTPAFAGGDDSLCSLPTPACIRNWTDDDDSDGSGGSPAAGSPGNAPPGVTQTPPHVRRALAAAAASTQLPPPQQQQQQQQQASTWVGVDADMAQAPSSAAAPRWASAEAAVELPLDAPAPAELFIPDSETEDELEVVLPAQLAASPRWEQQQQQQPTPPQPEQGHSSGPPSQQPLQQHHPALPPRQQGEQHRPAVSLPQQQQQQQQQPKRGLLQVSRSSAGGQAAPSCARDHAASVAPTSRIVAPAAATPMAAVAPLAGAGAGDGLPSPAGNWGASDAQPTSSCGGSRAASLGAASPGVSPSHSACHVQRPTAAAQQHHQPPAQQPQPQPLPPVHQTPRTVRDWSEDDISSDDDELPSPPAGQRGAARRGGITGLTQLDPSSLVIARPKPSASNVSWRSVGGGGGVLALKLLQRPPRGNSVRANHGLASLKGCQFAEQVQVSTAGGLVLSTKDKKTAVRLLPGGLTEEEAEEEDFRAAASSGSGGRRGSGGAPRAAPPPQEEEPTLAEAAAFYRLPADGSWWLEYCRFYTAAQAEEAAAAAGQSLALPPGFDRVCELLKAASREHAPLGDVVGAVQVRRAKQGSTALRLQGGTAGAAARNHFWRSAIDTRTWRVVTDRPAADYVDVD